MSAFWQAQDHDAFLQAMFHLPKGVLDARMADELLGMLAQLPQQFRQENPAADFARASLYMNNMRLNEARALLEPMARRLEQSAVMRQEGQLLPGGAMEWLGEV